MGYLDNSSITVDAILTKRGRELLARGDGSFSITQFALADDEIDYTLFNEDHPNGSQYAGEAIENMPLLEANPDENKIMVHKLVTFPRGTTKISETVRGAGFNLTALNSTSLFGTNTKLLTTITIEGVNSGARTTIPVEISKEVIAQQAQQGTTGITLA